MTEEARIKFLIVEDEQSIRRLCTTIGASLGLACLEADSAEAALQQIEANAPELIVTDLKLPALSGTDLLREARKLLPSSEIAIMTGHGSIESAVDAMKLGAYDYIEKPFRVEKLRMLLQRMAEKVRLVHENKFLRDRVDTEAQLDGIVGSSAKIQDVLRMVARLKDNRTPVLIAGESGTGKELVARAIHFRGPLAQCPFIAVDCGSLVPTLMESELFGHEKGSFTGALKNKAGLFQAANGGTIFLDEIGELPLEMQAKLLRVLQEKEVRPVGSNERIPLDVRVIAATNRDLEAAYRAGTFRKDLYFRLNVVTVHLPSLRERRSDIPLLAHYFLKRYNERYRLETKLTESGLKAMEEYSWPGNIRQLQHMMERLTILAPGGRIDATAVRQAIEQMDSREGASESLADTETEQIRRVLAATNGNKSRAAKILGIERKTLYRKLERMGL